VVKSDIIEAHPELGKALTGAWYETLAQLQGPERADALAYMASVTGTDAESFARQLTTTHLFSTPAEALAFLESGQPRAIMQSVAEFSWSHGLYGPFAPDAGFVGIRFEDGSIWGDERNTQLRFSSDILRLAADDAL
jgi:NitT/TauT family transport system substrate-binding protein